MKYEITPINQLLALRKLIVGTLLFCITVCACFSLKGYDPMVALVLAIYYMVLLIPTLWLHLEYYLTNKNDVFTIDPIEEIISFNQQDKYHFNQVEKIILVLTFVLYRNGNFKLLPFDNYHYAVIKLKTGEKFIFTSLMDFKVRETVKIIKGVPIERRRRFIPSRLLFRYWTEFWS